jgi:uncharacterized protein (TIGR03067 family)
MFRATALAVGLAAVLAVVGGTAAQDKKTDKELFQGDWKVVTVQVGGKDLRDQLPRKVVTFSGDKVTVMGDAEYKLDPSKTPKQIDVTVGEGPDDGPDQKGTHPGIYKLDGDKLVIHQAQPGQDRPTGFESKEGTKTLLLTLERVK